VQMRLFSVHCRKYFMKHAAEKAEYL